MLTTREVKPVRVLLACVLVAAVGGGVSGLLAIGPKAAQWSVSPMLVQCASASVFFWALLRAMSTAWVLSPRLGPAASLFFGLGVTVTAAGMNGLCHYGLYCWQPQRLLEAYQVDQQRVLGSGQPAPIIARELARLETLKPHYLDAFTSALTGCAGLALVGAVLVLFLIWRRMSRDKHARSRQGSSHA